MEQLTAFVEFEVWFLLGGLALVVGYKMLTRGINTAGLLQDKVQDKEHRGLSPSRIQLLLFTLVGAGAYLASVPEMFDAAAPKLPEVPAELLVLLGGSQAVYLGGKSYLRFFKGTPSPDG
ncbi:MAG: hypothetical protein FVQ81_18280 [Candidatus Glassbacteria bacterium]|nr:hypothetical protein [Candidatus Glassbacteria bacterium]